MPLTDYERLVSHIEAALPAVHKFAPPTPMLRLPRLDALIGGAVFLKAECLQATGSFKVRGALNVMTPLKQQQSVNHVVAFSSGNHGIGVAYAAKCLQMHASVVVPSDAPIRKVDRIRSLGANIIFTIDTLRIVSTLLRRYVVTPVPCSSNLTMTGAPLRVRVPAE